MRLTEARRLFFKLRQANRIEVCENHVIHDYPERGYSIDEILNLARNSRGTFQDTTDKKFIGRRFYWRTEDIREHSVRLVIEFAEDEDGQLILVVSAGERT